MADGDDLSVRFWGVRGSVATPGPDYVRYGGNTSCVEMRCAGRLLIFDAGTGLRPLGNSLKADGVIDADLFFSHTHFDHVVGLPFFSPLYDAENSFRFWSGHLTAQPGLSAVLKQMMQAPLFPVPFDIFGASIAFKDFMASETLEPYPGVVVRTGSLNHPNGATGYRVEHGGKSACYVTDTEHRPGEPNRDILELVEGADILIYDCTYTDEEYPAYAGWGHSTWQEGARLCDAAGVGQLAIFHHDPSHDDRVMDGIARAAERKRPGTVVAREGMILRP